MLSTYLVTDVAMPMKSLRHPNTFESSLIVFQCIHKNDFQCAVFMGAVFFMGPVAINQLHAHVLMSQLAFTK